MLDSGRQRIHRIVPKNQSGQQGPGIRRTAELQDPFFGQGVPEQPEGDGSVRCHIRSAEHIPDTACCVTDQTKEQAVFHPGIPVLLTCSGIAFGIQPAVQGALQGKGISDQQNPRHKSPWLTAPAGAMITMAILGVFLDFGLDYILLMCAFRSLDKDVIDAARVDGAGGRRLFFDIELPMVRPTVMVTVFLALKDAVLISAPVIILTEGGPFRSTETIMFYYYVEAFKSGNRAVQNSLSSLVLASAAAAMAIYHLSRRRKKP
ncbi:MAG: sugar ABC transporter permease [Spirochaetales bacterium]|nr:sugar ABC transporter permease [Spirochaetales bacterium]